MKNYFKVNSEKKINLLKIPTKIKPLYSSEKIYLKEMDRYRLELEEYQTILYAERRRSLIVIFQGMDTSGKDGAIKHVMSGVDPQGCSVISFKAPTATELDHDFLWRVNRALPARGQIGIFNRSYYEEALVTRVHPELLEFERLPLSEKLDKKFWQNRFTDIVNHEKYLLRQGYSIIKIFLHISKVEQKRRLLSRFENPKKHWKISKSDISERTFWKDYQEAYSDCIGKTSSKNSPWYIVPADDKLDARLMVSKILLKRFKEMNLHYPKLKAEERRKLSKLKSILLKK